MFDTIWITATMSTKYKALLVLKVNYCTNNNRLHNGLLTVANGPDVLPGIHNSTSSEINQPEMHSNLRKILCCSTQVGYGSTLLFSEADL